MTWFSDSRDKCDVVHEVAALADGSLETERRAAVLARVRESRRLSESLVRQRHALAAIRDATAPAPPSLHAKVASRFAQPRTPLDRAAGLDSPSLGRTFGWRAVVGREDWVAGLSATTVIFERVGSQVAYTVVSGQALDLPPGCGHTIRDEIAFAGFDQGDEHVVSWQRGGHTCVLSGHGTSRAELLEVASWIARSIH